MEPDILIEAPAWEATALERRTADALTATLEELGLEPQQFTLSLLACDDARIAELNAQFRGKAQATNVLSWPSEDRYTRPGEMPLLPEPHPVGPPEELGDIALAHGTVEREAAAGGIPFEQHMTHLLVHGILHLLGFDHIDDADADLMQEIETRILARLGQPDPY